MTGTIDSRLAAGPIPDRGDNPRGTPFESPPGGLGRARPRQTAPLPAFTRTNPVEWARRRRSDRESRRAEVARGRAVTRLSRLGDEWKVLDIQEIGLLNPNTFLAIGPGGVFVVVVKQQGRSRVRLAGDVVQVDGRRPQYIAEAKRAADETAKALSRTAGNTIPVTPILAFAGTGAIDVHGLPKGCLITSYRELDHLLSAYGVRIGPRTVEKLYSIAKHPVTWVDAKDGSQVEAYTWYTSPALTGKRPARR